jgi:hypothetical protein
MVTLMTLAWVLLTSHCKIEAVAGLEFLRCGSESGPGARAAGDACGENHTDSRPGDNHCEDAGCCALESAQYHGPRQHTMVPAAGLAIVTTGAYDLIAVWDNFLRKEVCLGLLTAAPPELASSWQFRSRAAQPVRAPSLAS